MINDSQVSERYREDDNDSKYIGIQRNRHGTKGTGTEKRRWATYTNAEVANLPCNTSVNLESYEKFRTMEYRYG